MNAHTGSRLPYCVICRIRFSCQQNAVILLAYLICQQNKRIWRPLPFNGKSCLVQDRTVASFISWHHTVLYCTLVNRSLDCGISPLPSMNAAIIISQRNTGLVASTEYRPVVSSVNKQWAGLLLFKQKCAQMRDKMLGWLIYSSELTVATCGPMFSTIDVVNSL
jgi:hypothetical protein